MSAHTNQDVLRSTLDELRYLWVDCSCLTPLDRSQVADGGYGRVYMEEMRLPSQPPRKVAVKQLWSVGVPDRLALRFARELTLWANLKHDNILELLGYYLSDDYTTARLISPFLVNGNVTQYISNANPTMAARLNLVWGMTRGMIYLHSLDPPICHGDLKPGNVLVTDTLDAVLCDFGLATLIQDSNIPSGFTTSRSIKGSIRYMGPELLLENEPKHSLASDVWAWACTTFEIIADTYPYAKCKSDTSIIKSMLESGPPVADDRLQLEFSRWELDTATGPFLISLPQILRNCWNFDSTKRPLLSDVWSEVKTSKGDDNVASPAGTMTTAAQIEWMIKGGGGSTPSASTTQTLVMRDVDVPNAAFASVTLDLQNRIADWRGQPMSALGALQMFDILSVRRDGLVKEFSVYLFKEAIICVLEDKKNNSSVWNRLLQPFTNGAASPVPGQNSETASLASNATKNKPVLRLKGRIYIRHIQRVHDTSTPSELSLAIQMDHERLESFVLIFRDRTTLERWRAVIAGLVDQLRGAPGDPNAIGRVKSRERLGNGGLGANAVIGG